MKDEDANREDSVLLHFSSFLLGKNMTAVRKKGDANAFIFFWLDQQ